MKGFRSAPWSPLSDPAPRHRPARSPALRRRIALLAIAVGAGAEALFPASIAAAAPAALRPPPAGEVAAVRAHLAPAQMRSIETDREYCGYLGSLPDGRLAFTEMLRGRRNTCTPRLPRTGFTPIASMHTHGAYDPTVSAEFPTVQDMDSDRREGVNGYVATPGGRLWYIDSSAEVVIQICGPGCLPQDRNFRDGDDGPTRNRYSRDELRILEGTN